MNIKNIFYLMLILLFVVPTFASQERIPEVKQGDCVNLTQLCGNCTSVNYTSVYNGNGIKVLNNVEAVKDGSEYIYEFCETNVTSTYIVNGIADVDGYPTPFAYEFDVTESGNELKSIMQGIYIFIIVYVLGLFWLSNSCSFYKYEEDNINAKKGFFWTGMIHIISLFFISWFDYMGYIGTAGTLMILALINSFFIVYLLYIWLAEMLIDPIDYAIEETFKNEK